MEISMPWLQSPPWVQVAHELEPTAGSQFASSFFFKCPLTLTQASKSTHSVREGVQLVSTIHFGPLKAFDKIEITLVLNVQFKYQLFMRFQSNPSNGLASTASITYPSSHLQLHCSMVPPAPSSTVSKTT